MTKVRLLRKVLAGALLALSTVGLLQGPASAAPARIGHANLKVNWAIQDSNGRRCSSTASNPYEQVLWANHNSGTQQTWRRFRCWDGYVEGYMTTYLSYNNGYASTSWTLYLIENGVACSQGRINSNINGWIGDPVRNYDSQLVVSGSSWEAFNGCRGRMWVNFIEGRRP